MRSRNARILIRAVQLGPRHVAVGLPALSLSAASSEKLERVCLNTWAIILAALGGVFEIFGVGMVVREISKDRKRAETLLDKERAFRPQKSRNPRTVHARSLESRSPLVQMQQGGSERQMLNHIASLATGINRLNAEVSDLVEARTGQILSEVDKGDTALNAVLRELLGANIRERVIGVVAIAVGIALSMTASIFSSLG